MLAAFAGACSRDTVESHEGGGRGRGNEGPVPVITTIVEQKPFPVNIPAVGTVESMSTVQIRAQVTGQLSAIHFAEGQDVRKGQPLFSLDPRPFQAAVAQAEAVLARDTATAKNAQAQQVRYEDLFKRGLLPRDQYETQTASAASSQATLQADQAAVDTARLNLQYTDVNAPMSGRTGALGAHVGDLIRANDTTAMLVINQLSPIYVTFSVPGRYLVDIRRQQAIKALPVFAKGQAAVPPGGQTAIPGSASPDVAASDVKTPGFEPGVREQGDVTFIDNSIDTTTGTIKLKGAFPNQDHALWPGLFVEVTLQLSTDPKAILVPASAVQASQNGQYVYVVKPDHTVELRNVTVQRQQGQTMVIAQGLSAGEEVVTEGQLRLTPGTKVTRRPEQGSGRENAAEGANGRQGTRANERAARARGTRS